MHVGDLGPYMVCRFRRNNVPFPITGMTFQVYFYNALTSSQFLGSGSFVITDGPGGVGEYHWHPNDTASPGLFDVYPRLIDPIIGQMTAKPQPLEIKAILT